VSTKPQRSVNSGAKRPTTDVDTVALKQRALRVMDREIGNYEDKGELSTYEASALTGYVRALVIVIQDERKATEEQLDGMTDEEIAAREAEILARQK
jgi:hypothetical protein